MKTEIQLSDEQIEHVMQQELMYHRDSMKRCLTLANDGNNCRIFSIDLEEEKKELRRYVEALDLIIDYYTVPKYRKYE